MPATPQYPGVYITERSTGVRPIAGVATSVTAFVGRTRRGPLGSPVRIASLAELDAKFGSAWPESTLAHAVRQFFENGGSDAIVLRLASGARPATIALRTTEGPLTLAAADPGTWGNDLRVRVEHAASPSRRRTATYTLTIEWADTNGGHTVTEHFSDLSSDPASRRFVTGVLERESSLVRVTDDVPHAPPRATRTPVAPNGAGSDGGTLTAADYEGDPDARTGMYALDGADLFNLLVLPPVDDDTDVPPSTWRAALAFCERRRAMLLVDAPCGWTDTAAVLDPANGIDSLGLRHANAALWFPRITAPDPLDGNRPRSFAASGAIAGVIARTDAQAGVWNAAAGVQATIRGASGAARAVAPYENDRLNREGVNCLREIPGAGLVVWGARTLAGADRIGSEWKYLPVRRLALYIEESVARGLRWAVFEPNDEPLWSRIRATVESFLDGLFRDGALRGTSTREAFFVRCDRGTVTQADIDGGVVNVVIGVAALRPSEFVIIQIRQKVEQTPAVIARATKAVKVDAKRRRE